ncbi:MAG: cytochrome ubiquinol oxidase subunit I [Betaproteobacteria bacterium]|nr:cytochrome ubiquinol oxidase subunit I [Betaproteobacteria bacterium]
MNELDPLLLARIQFAANVTFHILFPSITIGLGWVLLFFKLRFQSTRQAHWMDAYSFWVKVFALSFALGVVSGVTMSFQFGTNWPGFMNMMLASGLTASFLVAGLSAYRWRRGDRAASVSAALRTGVFTAALLIPVQIIVGDMHGLNTMKHQPAKLAAMEGIWETQRGVAAVLFAIPDSKAQANRMEIAIPKLASFYLTHDWDGEVKGLKAFDDKIPPVAPVFFAFRIMVGVGLLMLAIAWLAAWNMRSMTLLPQAPDWLYKGLVSMTFSGWIALVSGWYVTEMGRQPWLVSGVLTTAQAASSVPAPHIALSLAMYLSLYLVLLGAYVSVVFYLARKASTPELAQCARENSRPMEAAHA